MFDLKAGPTSGGSLEAAPWGGQAATAPERHDAKRVLQVLPFPFVALPDFYMKARMLLTALGSGLIRKTHRRRRAFMPTRLRRGSRGDRCFVFPGLHPEMLGGE